MIRSSGGRFHPWLTVRAQTTKSFNVNFFCHTQPEPSAEQEAIWRDRLSPYFAEHGIDASAIPTGPGRAFPLAASAIAPLRARAESQGSGDFSPLWAGQNVSGCKEVSAAVLTRELASELPGAR